MQKTKTFNTIRLIGSVAIVTLMASCQTLKIGLTPDHFSNSVEQSQPQFLEDFYHNGVAQSTRSPQATLSFCRAEMRCTQQNVEVASARIPDMDLMAESIISGDIGGVDLMAADTQNEIELAVYKNIYGEEFITGETSALVTQKFDPAKIAGSIAVDVLMNDASCFYMPLNKTKINSEFGWRRGRVHSGIDLDLEIGDTVIAIIDGIVVKAEYSGGYGNLVTIKHANGLETYYAHLSKIAVKPGDVLNAGDYLGLGGSTGRSTGPHLHFEVRYMGAALNPKEVIDFDHQSLKAAQLIIDKKTFAVTNANTASKASAKYYTVKKGDTLGKIASRNGTTVSKMCKLNGISSKKVLKPGQKLRVK